MRIEKINDNQIRCTLNQKDLKDREIGIKELAYGTDKAKALFRDLMEQASYEFGFNSEDIPLMIEAIPLQPDALMLIITKIEDPDELDTRFSQFTDDSEYQDEDDELYEDDEDSYLYDSDNAVYDDNDEADLLYEKSMDSTDAEEESDAPLAFAATPKQGETSSSDDFITLPEALGMEPRPKQKPERSKDVSMIYQFNSLEDVCQAAGNVISSELEDNTLFYNHKDNEYYLIIYRCSMPQIQFNSICSIINEYATPVRQTYATIEFFKEHYEELVSNEAIQKLAQIPIH